MSHHLYSTRHQPGGLDDHSKNWVRREQPPLASGSWLPGEDAEPYETIKAERERVRLAQLKELEDDRIYQKELAEVERERNRLLRIDLGTCGRRRGAKDSKPVASIQGGKDGHASHPSQSGDPTPSHGVPMGFDGQRSPTVFRQSSDFVH